MREISKYDDIIDSRDVIKRIEQLKDEREMLLDELTESQNCVHHHHNDTIPENIADYVEGREFLRCQEELTEWDDENQEELKSLESLADDASGSPDWEHGEMLIRDSYFKDYAQEIAEDCGMIPKNNAWPCTCIDWDQAAEELKMDYFSVEFDGVDYWIRN